MNMMRKGARVPSTCKCIKCGIVQNPFEMASFDINGDISKGICAECSQKKTADDKEVAE